MCSHFPLFSVTVTLARLLSAAARKEEEKDAKILFRGYAKQNCVEYVILH